MVISQRFVIRFVLLIALTALFLSCQHQTPAQLADTILDGAVVRYGGSTYEQVRVTFEHNNQQFQLEQKGQRYRYERFSKGASAHDIITPDSTLSTGTLPLNQAERLANRVALTTVAYWTFLPYLLRHTAGQKMYLGEVSINDELYFKIRILPDTTSEAYRVGKAFMLWIHTKENTVDYIAYERPDGKLRFGKAVHPQQVEGLRFQDVVFYQPVLPDATLPIMEKLFLSSKLSEAERFELKNLKVSTLSVQ
ncbi:MAG: DUF6503 family protein [Spirosomataceae bacterium]